MDQELKELLEKARTMGASNEDREERQIAMAAANGIISDSRVTVEAVKAVKTVGQAAGKPREK